MTLSTSRIASRSFRRFAGSQGAPRGSLERLGDGDLDAKAGKPDIGARAGRQQLNRRDPKIAQDLCPQPYFAPLHAALVLGAGFLLADSSRGHPRGAVPQIDEDALPGCLEPSQRRMDRLGSSE